MEKLIGRNGAGVGVQDALSDLLLMSLVHRLGLILGGDAIGDMFSVHACFAVVLRLKRRARAISDLDCLFRRAHFFSVLGARSSFPSFLGRLVKVAARGSLFPVFGCGARVITAWFSALTVLNSCRSCGVFLGNRKRGIA